jgi:hypothetical protein
MKGWVRIADPTCVGRHHSSYEMEMPVISGSVDRHLMYRPPGGSQGEHKANTRQTQGVFLAFYIIHRNYYCVVRFAVYWSR